MTESLVLVHSHYFHIELQAGELSVVRIKNEFIPKCAWWLLRQYGVLQKQESTSLFTSLIMDEEGMSIACEPLAAATLRFLISPEECTVSPQQWRALIINIADSAFDFPGTVYFLANTLSEEGLSIFHISTFESEVFLVQSVDVDKACSILQSVETSGKIEIFLDNPHEYHQLGAAADRYADSVDDSSSMGEESSTNSAALPQRNRGTSELVDEAGGNGGGSSSGSSASGDSNRRGGAGGAESNIASLSVVVDANEVAQSQMSGRSLAIEEEDENIDLDVSWIAPPIAPQPTRNGSIIEAAVTAESTKAGVDMMQNLDLKTGGSVSLTSTRNTVQFREGFHLSVLPYYVKLAKIADGYEVSNFADILSKLLLFDDRFSSYERLLRKCEESPQLSAVVNDSSLDPKNFTVSSEKDTSADSSSSGSGSSGDVSENEAATAEGAKALSSPRPFMWGIWQFDKEITLLLEESDLALFPKNALVTSPQRWRIIKLGGRPIGFDECGVVSSMSRIETNIPALNISTATTNCTLVPQELLESTVASLSSVLNCPVLEH